MKNSLVVALVVVTGSLALFWNSRKSAPVTEVVASETQNQAPQTDSKPKAGKKTKKAEAVPEALTVEKLKEVLPGYYVAKNSVKHENQMRRYQIQIMPISNPDLHDGKVVEGLIFSYDEKNPGIQSIGKLVFDSIAGHQVKFKLEKKDVYAFYADGNVAEEYGVIEFTLTPEKDKINVFALNDYNEKAFSLDLFKIDPTASIEKLKGKWKGIRKVDNEKIFLDFKNIKNFNEDFGEFKQSGTCFADTKFKIRPVDEKVAFVILGNASCQASTTVYKVIASDNELEAAAYRQYYETYEIKFNRD